MGLEMPNSMDDLVYWTSRKLDNGSVKAWVYREKCPNCGKDLMGKPTDEKGKVKVRANYYECKKCHHKIEKQTYEDTLTADILYQCPYCAFNGEAHVPYKRKKYMGVDALVFDCQNCHKKIPITKKMKNLA